VFSRLLGIFWRATFSRSTDMDAKMSRLTDATFKGVLADSAYALVDFYATWCGPCKVIDPLVNRIAETVFGIDVYKANIEDCPNMATVYRVQGVPTLLLLKKGDVASVRMGSITFTALVKWIEEHR